jgi:hypothetical protein
MAMPTHARGRETTLIADTVPPMFLAGRNRRHAYRTCILRHTGPGRIRAVRGPAHRRGRRIDVATARARASPNLTQKGASQNARLFLDNRHQYRYMRLTSFIKGRLSGRHAGEAERGAMPAGGIANPHSGGPGSPVGRHKDRSAGSLLNRR